jgi:ATP-dependent protease ClpP protease subunit
MDRNAATMAEDGRLEISLIGDITDHESDLTEKLLGIPWGGRCCIYFDSPGGSAYSAISLVSILRLRDIHATGVVTGECSSAALWPFAACRKRYVTRYSVMMFHPMKWQSEENVGIGEASEWARHFGTLQQDMDKLLAELTLAATRPLCDRLSSRRCAVGGADRLEATGA